MRVRCSFCDLPAEEIGLPDRRRAGAACLNLVTVVPLGPGASALVKWDPAGQPCRGHLRQLVAATVGGTA